MNSTGKAETTSGPAAQDTKSVSNSSAKSVVRLKYEMCKNFKETGSCKYGDRCLFAHGDHELINRGPPITEPEKAKASEDKANAGKKQDDAAGKSEDVEKDAGGAEDPPVANGSEQKANETTNDSTKLLQAVDLGESSVEKDQKISLKEQSSEHSVLTRSPNLTEQSCESEAILGAEDEIQDHGENSTTLSSIENNQRQSETDRDNGDAAYNLLTQAQEAAVEASSHNSQYQKNFECEDEFKELLENLDIQNIEIKASGSSLLAGPLNQGEGKIHLLAPGSVVNLSPFLTSSEQK